MIASLSLLNRFLNLPRRADGTQSAQFDVRLISEILTRQGFEVESVTERGAGFEKVVVGRIEDARPHPQADRLRICRVSVGASTPRQIVCGAANARAGLFVAVALPDASLPGGLKIGETTIRGIESRGMLCARSELGLDPLPGEPDGIWELGSTSGGDAEDLLAVLGKPVFSALGLTDVVLDLSVTPNRPDALCHLGIARELFVGLTRAGNETSWRGLDWIWDELQLPISDAQGSHDGHLVAISSALAARSDSLVVAGDAFSAFNEVGVPCYFYAVENVTPSPSPGWLRRVLESIGQNSVNSIVDLSNLVLLLTGQPSHAFDFAKISGVDSERNRRRLVIRTAQDKEPFTGLDGKERNLHPDDVVVADGKHVQALLGVLGGEHSKVDASTRAVVVEIAYPDAVSVRRTSRRIGRKTDSSFQFEKGIDVYARTDAAALLLDLIVALHPSAQFVGAVGARLSETRSREGGPIWSDEQLSRVYGAPTGIRYAIEPFASEASRPNRRVPHEKMPDSASSIPWNRNSLRGFVGAELLEWEGQLSILHALGFHFRGAATKEPLELEQAIGENSVCVDAPHWRWLDIGGIADLAEEVVRFVGIDQVPRLPLEGSLDAQPDDPHFVAFEAAAQTLSHLGYTEVTSFHFMAEEDLAHLGLGHASALGAPVRLLNPIIQDEPLLHTTLIPDLLRKVRHNVNYGTLNGQLFHLGRTYQSMDSGSNPLFGATIEGVHSHLNRSAYAPARGMAFSRDEGVGHRPVETPRLAAAVFGVKDEKNWYLESPRRWVLHDLMAHVRDLAAQLQVVVEFSRLDPDDPFHPALHPGRCVRVTTRRGDEGSLPVGWIGEIHPQALRQFGIDGNVFAFELNMAELFRTQQMEPARFVGRYNDRKLPPVIRDFAFLLDEKISGGQVREHVEKAFAAVMSDEAKKCDLSHFRVFDLYRGDKVPQGKKSLAFQICVEPLEETLSEQVIQKLSNEVIQSLQVHLGAELRK